MIFSDAKVYESKISFEETVHYNVTKFGADSNMVGINNGISAYISNHIEYFEGPVTKLNR